jgi:hypothetical protein
MSAWPTPILGGFPLERTMLTHDEMAGWRERRRRLAHPREDLTTLAKLEGRAAVCARGRMRARTPLPALLSDTEGIARRVDLTLGIDQWRWDLVHAAAQDFELEDARGNRVSVVVGPTTRLWSRALATVAWLEGEPVLRVMRLAFPPELTSQFFGHASGRAWETLFRDGDLVDVAGAAGHEPDPTAQAVGRHAAVRPTLVAAVIRDVI